MYAVETSETEDDKQRASNNSSVPCYDPATRQFLGSVPAMSKKDVEAKVLAAQRAAQVRSSAPGIQG